GRLGRRDRPRAAGRAGEWSARMIEAGTSGGPSTPRAAGERPLERAITGNASRAAHAPVHRVFRCDTPHDVLSACILANTLPRGRDALALCADKARGDREAFLQSMEMIACLHDWSSVVDISGLPMNRHWLTHATPGTRWQRLRDTVASMRELRQRLAPSFELDPRSRTLGAELDARVGEAY